MREKKAQILEYTGKNAEKSLKSELKVWEENNLDYEEVEAQMSILPDKHLVKFFIKFASSNQLKKICKEWQGRKEHKRLYHLAKQTKKKNIVIEGFDPDKTLKEYKPKIW